jgi:gluconate kinase
MAKRTVLVSGCSGAGKSFTGDYLEMMCGFYHVDGDTFMISKEPAHVILKDNLIKAFYEYWLLEKTAPLELWIPYHQAIVELVKKAHETHNDVVVSFSVYNREARDYFRSQLPDYVFIQLHLDEEELVKRHIKRFKAFADAKGQTVEETYESFYKEPYTMDNYLKQTRKVLVGLQPLEQDEILSFAIDVNNDDKYKKLHDALKLPPPQDVIPVEEIANRNYGRWKK